MRTSMKGVKPDFLPATLAKHFHGDSVQKRLPGKKPSLGRPLGYLIFP